MSEPDATARRLGPVTSAERIQALDVVRGFALFGIFMMNVEYFNRPTMDIGGGMQPGLSGIDWFATWFVDFFVQGKFWTIFSMLFGMGFAVMLSRAELAGRSFLVPYLRRILGLATFGAAHYIFLWSGDILFSYAIGAGALLIFLFGKWKPIMASAIVLAALAAIPGFGFLGIYAGVLLYVGLLSTYVRAERRVQVFKQDLPLFSFALVALGVIGLIAAVILALIPGIPDDPHISVTVLSTLFLIAGAASAKYYEPAELRSVRMAASIHVLSFLMMIIGGTFMYLMPPDDETVALEVVAAPGPELTASEVLLTQSLEAKTDEPKTELVAESGATDDLASGSELTAVAESDESAKSPEKTEAERKAEKKAEREKRIAQQVALMEEEERVLSTGGYWQTVEFRARTFADKMAVDGGFSSILLAMFLIGAWFVQSGVMKDTKAHLPLFRKMAFYGLPVGIGLGLVGGLITTTHDPYDMHDGFQLAMGLRMLGNLPASLGYLGVVVLMLHSNTVFSKISLLAPAGRMALTNYLLQSFVSTFIFYGYGLGHWGLPRAWQLVYVMVFFGLQVLFSHWWLKHYRYGPFEWFWRGFTYRETPAMRV